MDKVKIIQAVSWLKQAVGQYQGVVSSSNYATQGTKIAVLNSDNAAQNFKAMQDHLDLIVTELMKE